MFNKSLNYTRHARDRMLQYSITETQVAYCLKNYDISYTKPNGTKVYEGTLSGGMRIKVVLKEENNRVLVITVADKAK